MDNYQKLAMDNLHRVLQDPPPDLARRLGAEPGVGGLMLQAFGRRWRLTDPGPTPEDGAAGSVEALLVSIYAGHAFDGPVETAPFLAFKELPGSAPYAGAFIRHAQLALAPHVGAMAERLSDLCGHFNGAPDPQPEAGDVAFTVWPLPKIALRYICYHADEDFPAAVTCLFSRSAPSIMPTDALADVGEYTAKAIVRFVRR